VPPRVSERPFESPRQEASERLEGRYEVRVLEPSPPAVSEPPWFADDPVARGEVPTGRPVVSPVGNGDLRWTELSASDAGLADWCAERWLGPWRRLGSLPPDFAATRLALHTLAETVVSPARKQVNGKIGLRYTRGGFGTPFFGEDRQLRVEGTELVIVERGEETRREPLDVDAGVLGDWYGFAASVLEELRAGAEAQLTDPSRVQLWPEHFDIALELGREDAGARAAYGCSPGDAQHPEPYLYVGPWVATPSGELWNATAFPGAELSYAALLEAEDQRAAALEFFAVRLAALSAGA
jgi:hypothetical protein